MRLPVEAPFHLEATVRVLQRRPQNLVDQWTDNRYRRVLKVGEHHVLATVENCGTIDAPDVRCSFDRALTIDERDAAMLMVRRILGLDCDPQPLLRAARQVREFETIALALRGMRPPRFASLFETFARVIPFQQLSLDAGVSIVTRLVERFGAQFADGADRCFAFPEAQKIAHARIDSLRRCGLSARKSETLRELARMIESGDLDESQLESMSTADALRRLIELPGIGLWSASVVLLRGLRRLDVFPPGDVGAARGLRTVMGIDAAASIDAIVEAFGSQRGYLYFHVLGASLLKKSLLHPAPPIP